MPLTYTAEELIETVRLLGMLPSVGEIGQDDDDVVRHLSEFLKSRLVPEMIRIREEYYVVTERLPLSGSVSRYRIPARAVGNRLRDVLFVTAAGDRRTIWPIPRERLAAYNTSGTTTEPTGYYLEGNRIVLVPALGAAAGWLELSYFFRPGDLVKSTQARQVYAIPNSPANTVTFTTSVPASWVAGIHVDIHSGMSGAEIKIWDKEAVVAGANYLTFTDAIDGTVFGTDEVVPGDWVCMTGEAAVPGVPLELHPILARGACLRLATALNDKESIEIHSKFLQDEMRGALAIVENRIEGRPLTISTEGAIVWEGGW